LGGWIASLVALARPELLARLLLIAPAPAFTETLLWAWLNDAQRRGYEDGRLGPAIREQGTFFEYPRAVRRRSPLVACPDPCRSPPAYAFCRAARTPKCPGATPWPTPKLATDDVVFSLIKDGDHIARSQDFARLIVARKELNDARVHTRRASAQETKRGTEP
jgi:pimeloyl-ACP methyl ester carboxylesterase